MAKENYFFIVFFYSSSHISAQDSQSQCIESYRWHINSEKKSDLQRLRPGTFTREEVQEAKERRDPNLVAFAAVNGVLVELIMLPAMLIASPFVYKNAKKIKRWEKMQELLLEVYEEAQSPQNSRIDYFYQKIKAFRYPLRDNQALIKTRLTKQDFISCMIFWIKTNFF